MSKWNIIYDVSTSSSCEIVGKTRKEAIELVIEIIGDDVVIDKIISEKGNIHHICYSLVVSYETQVSASSQQEANNKVLMVIPNATNFSGWELK